jgi:hypothetical protein
VDSAGRQLEPLCNLADCQTLGTQAQGFGSGF